MPVTGINEVQANVQTMWSELFMDELREDLLLGSLVNKDYDGDIKFKGDTVKVSQINAAAGSLKTVGVDADTFDTELLSTTQIDIKADKRAVGAYEFDDLSMIQSQIGNKDSEIRASLLFAVQKKINSYLYSLVAPSVSAPAHKITGVTDFNAAQLSIVRNKASKAKWMKNKPWWLLSDPDFYGNMTDDAVLTSSDYGATDAPMISGQMALKRKGFNILEDNSDAILTLGTDAAENKAIAFHPDFMHLVMQTQPTFKISDQHANKRFGFIISVDLVFGAKMGIDGDKKVITISEAV